MRRRSILLAILLSFLSGEVACSLFTARNVETALDVAKVLCVIANAESEDATIKAVCKVTEAEDPLVRDLLSKQRQASRRYAASLTQDAGPVAMDATTSPEGGTP